MAFARKCTVSSLILMNCFALILFIFYHSLQFGRHPVRKTGTIAGTETITTSTMSIAKSNPKEAEYSNGKCVSVRPVTDVFNTQNSYRSKHVTLLTNFVDFRHQNYRPNLRFGEHDPPSDYQLEERMAEITTTLQSNLQHPNIASIHILVQEWESLQFLRSLDLVNREKMVIQFVNETVTMKMQLIYASRCLAGKIVSISHQDNMFGAGWNRLEPNILKETKILYALTRHSALNSSCKAAKSFVCDDGASYVGSHDTFVFYVRNITTDQLKPLDSVTPNLNGMENVLMWLFRDVLGYKVLNPCKILFVHHQHCVSIREKGRRRVNTRKTTGICGFTNKLKP